MVDIRRHLHRTQVPPVREAELPDLGGAMGNALGCATCARVPSRIDSAWRARVRTLFCGHLNTR